MIGHEPIHEYFGLSYANYLVLPRSVLQSMPLEWQQRLVECLTEVDELFGDVLEGATYRVRLLENNKLAHDPLADYERGRRRLSYWSNKTALTPKHRCPTCKTPCGCQEGQVDDSRCSHDCEAQLINDALQCDSDPG